MSKLELKIHPPIVFACCAGLSWLISKTADYQIEFYPQVKVVIVITTVVAGVALAGNAVFQFHRVGTTIEPTKPDDTSALVTRGVYKFTRNPMYLGLLLVLTGWVVFLGNIFGILTLVAFVGYITHFQIRPEERVMASKFGEAYANYCQNVRRWL